MGKYTAISAFDQLAADYLEAKNTALAAEGLTEKEKKEQQKTAKNRVDFLRSELTYGLDLFYGSSRHKNIRSAMKNDLRGGGKV